MPTDESLPAFRPSTSSPGTGAAMKLPTPAWAKSAATPGGVPPMFAGSSVQRQGDHAEPVRH